MSLTDRLLDWIPEKNRHIFLLAFGAVIFLAICITVMALAGGRQAPERRPVMTASPTIPAEELFYPEEPDFLPPLLLEREPRQGWTTRELELYWQDPKAGNEEKLREIVKTAVDKIMDGVP